MLVIIKLLNLLRIKLLLAEKIEKPEIIVQPTLIIGDGEKLSLDKKTIIKKDIKAVEFIIDFKNQSTISKYYNSQNKFTYKLYLMEIPKKGMEKETAFWDDNIKFSIIKNQNFQIVISILSSIENQPDFTDFYKKIGWFSEYFFKIKIQNNKNKFLNLETKLFTIKTSCNPPKLILKKPWYKSPVFL